METEALSPKAAAEALGVATCTVLRYLRRGHLRGVQLRRARGGRRGLRGSAWIIPRQAIRSLLEVQGEPDPRR